ncbi:hydrolase [Paenibacillus alkaliterrae]|uniref:HAD family hydrolase n=1 Tax=Paenibacillus alkaliterrae TaxID=320909 RepID=UPI001F33E789|nr:HAD family hydrolase [Paenibacillus alkaliterrae]MCF2941654.1 hydrolase [Paenibacillus alkaliterrae]
MIFASDLDQTLIYSVRSKGDMALEDMVPVELYEGRHISYMTKPALDKLRQLAGMLRFVPVTTRIPEQFNRIFGIKEQLQPEYVIVSNGGTILVNGRIDQEWHHFVREAVKSHCAESSEVAGLFDRIAASHWVKSSDLCDGLFYSIAVDRDNLPLDSLEELKQQLASLGWSYSLQGRKIYLVPEKVSKGAAIQYVKEKLASTYVYAAGDSLLDESLLLAADYAVAPVHGELGRSYSSHPHIRFTSARGALASEELLDSIMEHAGR